MGEKHVFIFCVHNSSIVEPKTVPLEHSSCPKPFPSTMTVLCNSDNNTSGVHLNVLKVGVEESIVNAPPLCSLQSKNTNNAKSELDLNSWSVICNRWCVHNRLFNAYFEDKFNWTPDTITIERVCSWCMKIVAFQPTLWKQTIDKINCGHVLVYEYIWKMFSFEFWWKYQLARRKPKKHTLKICREMKVRELEKIKSFRWRISCIYDDIVLLEAY
jgi:hypothetical protein